ncbi:MAG: VOC family protein [Pseudomonadota bacterium]
MTQERIVQVAYLVRDYDEAIEWFTQALGFELREDTPLPAEDKRWVVVAPAGHSSGVALVLAVAKGEQAAMIGQQGAGRVWLFLQTSDFPECYARLKAAGVRFEEAAPREEAYGTVIVFQDLYGNLWDLIQPR